MITSNTAADDKRRILQVTAGNLRNNHLYVNGHLDFFPPDCVGPPNRRQSILGTIYIELDGLNKTIATDIGRDSRTGKPRGFLRDRSSVGRFYAHHALQPGARLALERLTECRYRLSVEAAERPRLFPPTAAEFF
jgi:hypothetical protein